MTNIELLGRRIKEAGFRRKWIAQQMHITYGILVSRLRGETEFKQSEILELSKLLKLTDDEILAIFFG